MPKPSSPPPEDSLTVPSTAPANPADNQGTDVSQESAVGGLPPPPPAPAPGPPPLLATVTAPPGQGLPPALPGLDLRGYQLLDPLGRGGMGDVYRVCDPALGRDLALKVMKADLQGHAPSERRFLREARVTGSLQHPGIVPVHNLGRMANGRLFFTMKLVRGRTFADILKESAGKADSLPALLSVFEKVCQAVAYAHSKGVIHRDLKPANVMVGKFGEVQVMDWGLAKLLADQEPRADDEDDGDGTVIRTESTDGPGEVTRAGDLMGTLAYMPPEQARGQVGQIDERSDVFALGAILCEILTGRPPYSDLGPDDLEYRAKSGDMPEALKRLETCGADAELLASCRECLSAAQEGRPRSAQAVAERVAAYQAAVQERLRQAEMERVAAEARAQEEHARAQLEQERTQEAKARLTAERRARRRLLALAASLLVLVLGLGGTGLWLQWRQERVDREVLGMLERAGGRLEEGWNGSQNAQAHDVGKLTEADHEVEMALSLGATKAVEERAAHFREEAQERLRRAKKNRELLDALLDVSGPQETLFYATVERGRTLVLSRPSADDQYAAAFRRWGLEVDGGEESEVVRRLSGEPPVVREELIAGLDSWTLERLRQKGPEAEWRRLFRLAEGLDGNERRRLLRASLFGERQPRAETVAGLLGASPPWPSLWESGPGLAWRPLLELRSRVNPATEPVPTVLLLAQASLTTGDVAGAEQLLRDALVVRPEQVVLLEALGKMLLEQHDPAQVAEAIEYYRAARALRPGLGVGLAWALLMAGRQAEGESVLRDLAHQQPTDPGIFLELGNALVFRKRPAEAEAEYRQAIALKKDFAEAYFGLGVALAEQKRWAEAEAEYRQAIALKKDYAEAYGNLGNALAGQNKLADAEAEYHKVITLKPNSAEAYNNLGVALAEQKRWVDAEVEERKAIALKPYFAMAYCNLGVVLEGQNERAKAEAEYRKAIALKPDYEVAYYNLGHTLVDQKRWVEAEEAHRKAIALKPDYAEAHNNLGIALVRQKRPAEAEAVFHKAIALEPGFADACTGLGVALTSQGRFKEALDSLEKGIRLLPDRDPRRVSVRLAVIGCQRLVLLEARLPAVRGGTEVLADASEQIEFGELCYLKKGYAAASRFYADAFRAAPLLGNLAHRYRAACSAVLAAAGQDKEARLLPDQVVMFRRWALGWLRDDLANYSRVAAQGHPAQLQYILEQLTLWQSDPDLASVRDGQALGRLPENERAEWRRLWHEVDDLAKDAAKKGN